MTHLHPAPQRDPAPGPRGKPPKPARRRGALPQHAEQHCAEEWRDEEAEERLHVIHDAGELHHEIRGADAYQHAENRAPAANADVMRIGDLLLEHGTMDVVGPDGEGRTTLACR